ncbi:MAG TPA: NirD/YgiW/YdeI family stress tolerance protein [Woeseiaceae bacterium]|nr:NirD/YgiW/YdeI family stress tolerance protein [Woeseiaceae bacterium]
MKRSFYFLAAGALSLGVFSLAAHAQGQGGFRGPDNLRVVTVAEALELADDTDVKIQGRIVRSLGDEKYEFTDGSATIVVEIDDDDWGGLEATPDMQVEISGEIDEERNGNELDADTVRQL